jgi:hypothetical protein
VILMKMNATESRLDSLVGMLQNKYSRTKAIARAVEREVTRAPEHIKEAIFYFKTTDYEKEQRKDFALARVIDIIEPRLIVTNNRLVCERPEWHCDAARTIANNVAELEGCAKTARDIRERGTEPYSESHEFNEQYSSSHAYLAYALSEVSVGKIRMVLKPENLPVGFASISPGYKGIARATEWIGDFGRCAEAIEHSGLQYKAIPDSDRSTAHNSQDLGFPDDVDLLPTFEHSQRDSIIRGVFGLTPKEFRELGQLLPYRPL